MNFPKLQMLTEARKKDPAEEEMSFDLDNAGEGETKAKPATKPKADDSVVDKAAALAFLKGCDAKCRADVKKKLDKLVAADEAAAK